MDVRLIIDPPQPADWNMSVDQAMLDAAGDCPSATVRFYRWDRPSLSLGYFQHHVHRRQHPASQDLPWVRRPTGGGAIVHDNELTYCVAAPVADRFRNCELIVADIHRTLIDALASWAIVPSFAGCSAALPAREEAFLCFQRRSPHDLLLGGEKIAGSAQRRYRRVALIHGSVLVERSANAVELPGICDLSGKSVPIDQLVGSWIDAISYRFKWHFHAAALSDEEQTLALHWRDTRFASPAWNLKR